MVADQRSASQRLKDDFDDTDYEELDIIMPPYDLPVLAHFLEVNVEHYRCVKQKAIDTISGGHKINMRDSDKNSGTTNFNLDNLSAEQRQQYNQLKTFFDSPNEEMTMFELLEAFLTDYDGLGVAYLEVTRGMPTIRPSASGGAEVVWGDIQKLYHIPARTMRIRKHGDGYVQKRGVRKRFFKKFGDPRLIDAENGKELTAADLASPGFTLNRLANEVIYLYQYHPSSDYYGIPDFVPAIGAIVANLNVRDYNISYFDNSAVPLFAVVLEGAEWDDDSRTMIEDFFQKEVKGTNNGHKTLILEIPPGKKDEQPAKIQLMPLQPQVKDGYFTNFRRDNRDEIIRAHNMPPFRIGIIEVANIGSGTGTAQLLNYQQSVILPRQKKIEYRINKLLIQNPAGFGFKDWEWSLVPVDISEKERMALVHERYGKLGAMTINEIRRDLGLPAVEGGDVAFIIAAPDKITLIPQLAEKLKTLTSNTTSETPDTNTLAGSVENPAGTPEEGKVLSAVAPPPAKEVA
jgi:PBSX family phage portal protein